MYIHTYHEYGGQYMQPICSLVHYSLAPNQTGLAYKAYSHRSIRRRAILATIISRSLLVEHADNCINCR